MASEPSNAEMGDVVAAAAYHNGYFISNETDETLTQKEIHQPGGTACGGGDCVANGEGFGEEPPQSIAPHTSGYFDIPMYVYTGATYDNTDLTYVTESGDEVTFHANVMYKWWAGLKDFNGDLSSAKSEARSATVSKRATGRSTQTFFEVS